MSIEQYASYSKIGKDALNYLVKAKVISKEITENDRLFLDRLERVWSKPLFLKPQLRKLKVKDRKRLIEDPEVAWISYCKKRLRDSYRNNEVVETNALLSEIELFYGIQPNASTRRKLKSIRTNTRYHLKKTGENDE
jgi:hypothetical protein